VRLAVVGSRDFTNHLLMRSRVDDIDAGGWIEAIVSGGAAGADSLAPIIAQGLEVPCTVHKPEWDKHGKAAGFIRNQAIVDDADAVAAFFGPGPETKGTQDTIRRARKARKPVHIYYQREAP